LNLTLEGKKVIFAAAFVLLLAVSLLSIAQIANVSASSHDVGATGESKTSNTIKIELANLPPRGGDYDSGDDVVIEGTFSEPVSGRVILTFTRPDGTTFTRRAEVTDGSFSYTYAAIGVGDWSVVASFDGNDTYESSRSRELSFVLSRPLNVAGSLAGGLIFWGLLIGGILYWRKKRKQRRRSKNETVIWSRQQPTPAEAPTVAVTAPVAPSVAPQPVPAPAPAVEEPSPQETKPKAKAKTRGKAVKSKKSTKEVNFCPSCGTAVDKGAEFCHKCGTELR